MKTSLIILAAGMGTRMNSEIPKVLHAIAGDPMLVHAMAAGAMLEPEHTIVVAGHGAAEVTASNLPNSVPVLHKPIPVEELKELVLQAVKD